MGQVSKKILTTLQEEGWDVIQMAIKVRNILLEGDRKKEERERDKNHTTSCNFIQEPLIPGQLKESNKKEFYLSLSTFYQSWVSSRVSLISLIIKSHLFYKEFNGLFGLRGEGEGEKQ